MVQKLCKCVYFGLHKYEIFHSTDNPLGPAKAEKMLTSSVSDVTIAIVNGVLSDDIILFVLRYILYGEKTLYTFYP